MMRSHFIVSHQILYHDWADRLRMQCADVILLSEGVNRIFPVSPGIVAALPDRLVPGKVVYRELVAERTDIFVDIDRLTSWSGDHKNHSVPFHDRHADQPKLRPLDPGKAFAAW